MSRKARKSASSISYHLQKAYWKLVTLKPSTVVLAALAIAVSVFLLGGGIYDILEQPAVGGFTPDGRLVLFDPRGLNEQLLGESIAAIILYSLGTTGLLLIYQSTKYAYNPREAHTTLLIGMLLLLIGWIIVEFYFFPSTIGQFR